MERSYPWGEPRDDDYFDESSPRARQVKGMETYETQSAVGSPCGGSDMGERPAQDARQQSCTVSQPCEVVTARRDGNTSDTAVAQGEKNGL